MPFDQLIKRFCNIGYRLIFKRKIVFTYNISSALIISGSFFECISKTNIKLLLGNAGNNGENNCKPDHNRSKL
jgi:hypothetical protein